MLRLYSLLRASLVLFACMSWMVRRLDSQLEPSPNPFYLKVLSIALAAWLSFVRSLSSVSYSFCVAMALSVDWDVVLKAVRVMWRVALWARLVALCFG